MSTLEELKKEHPVITSCAACIFKKMDGNTQTDCKLDRINKLEQNGATIIGQDDGNLKYLLVCGRLCNLCRDSDWGKKVKRKDWVKTALKEVQPKIDFIINTEDNKNIDEVLYTFTSIYTQNPKANSIFVRLSDTNTIPIVNLITTIQTEFTGVAWKIERVSLDKAIRLVSREFYHLAFNGYAVFEAGDYVLPNYMEKIDWAINHKCERFVAILPNSDCMGYLIQKLKNRPPLTMFDIENAADQYKHMVKRWIDL
jgi:hypothetical protein